jgi:serine phosphatase RsbU (regulator of sigma subunit)
MKKSLKNKLMIVALFLFFAASLAFAFHRYSAGEDAIRYWAYLSEILLVASIFFYYRFIQKIFDIEHKTIQEVLRIFIKLLGGLYLLIILLNLILSPAWSPATTPQSPETIATVIYNGLTAAIAIGFFVPMLMIINKLIFYKRKKSTTILIPLLYLFTLAGMFTSIFTNLPLNINFEGEGSYNSIALIGALIIIFLVSFRNSWITYLTRKEKISYFFISIVLIWATLYLYNFAFAIPVPSHSLAISAFTNVSWWMLTFYTISCSLYLLIQLPTAKVFDRKMKEVQSLHDLTRSISAEIDFNKLVRLITDTTFEVIESNSTWLELYNEANKTFSIVSAKNLTELEINSLEKQDRQYISDKVLQTANPILINEFTKSGKYNYLLNWKADIGSLIGAPLISGSGRPLGILYASKSTSFGFDPDDLAMLEAYANQAVVAMDNASLLKQSLERERLEQELKIARDVQQRLLPQVLPSFDGIEVESLMITAYEVGGDYYDFVNFENNHLGFIIGDVSGKGTSAAFYMAEAKGVLQSLCKTHSSPKNLLINTNRILYDSMDRKTFITMTVASIDCETRTLYFSRAGHCPLIKYDSKIKKCEMLQPGGIGIGLDKGNIFESVLEEKQIALKPNDIYIFYTDGLSEAMNEKDEEYGDNRLAQLIEKNADKSVTELKELIIDSILSFLNGKNLSDDLTLILLKT